MNVSRRRIEGIVKHFTQTSEYVQVSHHQQPEIFSIPNRLSFLSLFLVPTKFPEMYLQSLPGIIASGDREVDGPIDLYYEPDMGMIIGDMFGDSPLGDFMFNQYANGNDMHGFGV